MQFGAKICLLTSFRDTCLIEIIPKDIPHTKGTRSMELWNLLLHVRSFFVVYENYMPNPNVNINHLLMIAWHISFFLGGDRYSCIELPQQIKVWEIDCYLINIAGASYSALISLLWNFFFFFLCLLFGKHQYDITGQAIPYFLLIRDYIISEFWLSFWSEVHYNSLYAVDGKFFFTNCPTGQWWSQLGNSSCKLHL